ncbi:TPA: restriction endonuclease subunit S [Citrobacter braakii]
MVPKGWCLGNFRSLRISTIDGDRGKNYPKKDDYLTNGYALFLGADNINSGSLTLDKCIFISKEKHDAMNKGIVKDEDILLVMRGNGTGRSCIYINRMKHQAARINSGLVIIRNTPEFTDVNFLHQLMQSSFIQKQFLSFMFGSAQPQLTIQLLNSLIIPAPPLVEQKKIAQILSTWDKAISVTEKLLANSQQQKKALMQQLLTGKKRLLDDKRARFSGEWKPLSLQIMAEIIVSPVDKKTEADEIPVELCNYTDVYYNNVITNNINFMKATATKAEIEKYTLKKGDVIITKDSETPGDIAIPALVSENLNGVVCGYHLAIIRPRSKFVIGAFLNYLFSMQKTRYYFFTLATGATRFGLSVGGINHAHFNIPDIVEQQKIAEVLSAADAEISTLEKKLTCLKDEKKALMQQLLTGKRRVSVPVKVEEKEAVSA